MGLFDINSKPPGAYQMIKEYVSDLASQMGINLYKIVFTEGYSLSCLDAHLLCICSENKLVSEFIRQSDIDILRDGTNSEVVEMKVRSALERLKMSSATKLTINKQ